MVLPVLAPLLLLISRGGADQLLLALLGATVAVQVEAGGPAQQLLGVLQLAARQDQAPGQTGLVFLERRDPGFAQLPERAQQVILLGQALELLVDLLRLDSGPGVGLGVKELVERVATAATEGLLALGRRGGVSGRGSSSGCLGGVGTGHALGCSAGGRGGGVRVRCLCGGSAGGDAGAGRRLLLVEPGARGIRRRG